MQQPQHCLLSSTSLQCVLWVLLAAVLRPPASSAPAGSGAASSRRHSARVSGLQTVVCMLMIVVDGATVVHTWVHPGFCELLRARPHAAAAPAPGAVPTSIVASIRPSQPLPPPRQTCHIVNLSNYCSLGSRVHCTARKRLRRGGTLRRVTAAGKSQVRHEAPHGGISINRALIAGNFHKQQANRPSRHPARPAKRDRLAAPLPTA